MPLDLRLMAIAGPPFLDSADIVNACVAAEAGGVTAVQVRLKREPASVILDVTEQVIAAVSLPVYVNDRADVALAARAHGVHLGADDVPVDAVRRISPRTFKIGVSVGDEAEAAAATKAEVDYWSIGSVYATASKSDAGSPVGPAGFESLSALAPRGMPVIAIGGINASNAAEIIGSGAQGIAVISAVFGGGDVERAAHQLRRVVDEALSG
jgi:thiamine-phosphate pyrophosphorylase